MHETNIPEYFLYFELATQAYIVVTSFLYQLRTLHENNLYTIILMSY